ncbi:MAG: helix-turn-helix transcriptional regulator [Bdellovibrionota bacterium]
MSIKKRKPKSDAIKFLEELIGETVTLPLTLHALRKCDELSQADFAAKLGISRSHLCDIEKGRKSVSPARAAQFAQALSLPTTHFVQLALQDQVDKAGLNVRVDLSVA